MTNIYIYIYIYIYIFTYICPMCVIVLHVNELLHCTHPIRIAARYAFIYVPYFSWEMEHSNRVMFNSRFYGSNILAVVLHKKYVLQPSIINAWHIYIVCIDRMCNSIGTLYVT